jgi:hypothetical protein
MAVYGQMKLPLLLARRFTCDSIFFCFDCSSSTRTDLKRQKRLNNPSGNARYPGYQDHVAFDPDEAAMVNNLRQSALL